MAHSPRMPVASLISREERHRRALLIGIGAVIALSLVPLFGHHFARGLEQAIHGVDHLGPLCLIALHELLWPVHELFHVLIVVGLAYAVFDRARAMLGARRVLSTLDAVTPREGDPFWLAADAVGLDPERLRIVEGLPNPAFTIGWLRPRVYVAASLPAELSAAELRALLAHEGAHLARRDPLRLSALRFLALLLFWIPALRRLADDVADEVELQADDVAARMEPLALAGALLSLAQRPGPERVAQDVVGFAALAGLLQRRIRRLAGDAPPFESRVTRRSVAGALLALLLVALSGAVMVHPLPQDGAGHLEHCNHPGQAVIRHLLCAADVALVPGDACPHGHGS